MTDERDRGGAGGGPEGEDPTAGLGAWIEIDHQALLSNLAAVRRRLGDSGLVAVLKADAYGHGAVEVARTLARRGVDRFAVARLAEAAALRAAGIEGMILLLAPLPPERFAEVRRLRLVPVLNSLEQVERWAEDPAPAVSVDSATRGSAQQVHLKIDTGMTRLGVAPDELAKAVARLGACAGLQLTGLMTHLAEAEAPASERTAEQTRLFGELVGSLPPERLAGLELHLANSGGALHHPATRRSYARVGLALYGYDPAAESTGAPADDLTPVLSVRGRVARLRRVPAGTRVGYGGTWTAQRESLIATVAIGYADGLPLSAGNRGEALCLGRRLPIVGAVSMDLVTLDATDLEAALDGTGAPGLVEGTSVSFIDGAAGLPATELARAAGTSVYELLCRFGSQRLGAAHRTLHHARRRPE